MDTVSPSTKRKFRPQPLVIALLVVSFSGGSCTLQKLVTRSNEVLSQEQIVDTLKRRGGLPQQDSDDTKRFVESIHRLMTEQVRVSARFRVHEIGFGLLLIAAYSFAFLAAIRVLKYVPQSAKMLSRAALYVLPARVAMGAIDLATARQLEPALKDAFTAYATVWLNVPLGQAQQMSATVGLISLVFQVAVTFVVCLLFALAWRYFQRPDFISYFDHQCAQKWKSA